MSMLDFALGLLLASTVLGTGYLVLVRPQLRRLNTLQQMTERLAAGDTIVTAGGLVGTVVREGDSDTVFVEVAQGVEVSIRRNRIDDVMPKDGRRHSDIHRERLTQIVPLEATRS